MSYKLEVPIDTKEAETYDDMKYHEAVIVARLFSKKNKCVVFVRDTDADVETAVDLPVMFYMGFKYEPDLRELTADTQRLGG